MISKVRSDIIIALVTIAGWIGAGTVFFKLLEGWTWIQSFYFSVVTLTTVGYGDLVPSTDATRLFIAFYILIGVGLVFTSLTVIGRDALRSGERRLVEHRTNRSVWKNGKKN